MSTTQPLNYDEPDEQFADEDKPWKDLERLLDLAEKKDTQKEVAAALGCTPSTISYWLEKARDEVEIEAEDEELQCEYHEVCGNQTDNRHNTLCTVCLTVVRHNDSDQRIQPSESPTLLDHMEELYDEYSDLVDEQQAVYDELHGNDSEDES